MTTQRLIPEAILFVSNLTGTVAAVQDDPDAPDGTWMEAVNDAAATVLRVSFATPAGAPVVGAGLQEFRAFVRATGPGLDPTVTFQVREANVVRATSAAIPVSSETGQLVSFTWDASVLVNPSGADVECRLAGTVAGVPILDPFDTVEVGAVEWNVVIPTQASGTLHGGGAIGGTGTLTMEVGAVGASGGEPGVNVTQQFRILCDAATESLPPDALLSLGNLVGVVGEVQDDPDAPDGAWLDAVLPLGDTEARVSFPSPVGPPDSAQRFRVLLRPTFVADPPPLLLPPVARVSLWEAGAPVGPAITLSIPSPTVVHLGWDAGDLGDPSGAGVQCRVEGFASVLEAVGWTVEVGALRWDVDEPACVIGPASGGGVASTAAIELVATSDVSAGGGGETAFRLVLTGATPMAVGGGMAEASAALVLVGSGQAGAGGHVSTGPELRVQAGGAGGSGGGVTVRSRTFLGTPRSCPAPEPTTRVCEPGVAAGRSCEPAEPSSRRC